MLPASWSNAVSKDVAERMRRNAPNRSSLLALALLAGCVPRWEIHTPFPPHVGTTEPPLPDAHTAQREARLASRELDRALDPTGGLGSSIDDVREAKAWITVLDRIHAPLTSTQAAAIRVRAVRWLARDERLSPVNRDRCNQGSIRRRLLERCRRDLGRFLALREAVRALERASADPEPYQSLLDALPHRIHVPRGCVAEGADDSVSAFIEHQLALSATPVSVRLDKPRCIRTSSRAALLVGTMRSRMDSANLHVLRGELGLESFDRGPLTGDPEFDGAPVATVFWMTGGGSGANFYRSYLRRVRGRWRVLATVYAGSS